MISFDRFSSSGVRNRSPGLCVTGSNTITPTDKKAFGKQLLCRMLLLYDKAQNKAQNKAQKTNLTND
jgi:hypothetical protein